MWLARHRGRVEPFAGAAITLVAEVALLFWSASSGSATVRSDDHGRPRRDVHARRRRAPGLPARRARAASVDAGGGWLIFALPPAELAAHPGDGGGATELYLMCDDVEATIAQLEAKGVEPARPVSDEGWAS